ncbi:HNH endonuclease signature motif containing protein [Ilumatobacter nonamiensis]|uniref:HNH endonuclease signature motif containing protein n=1 Tax=Ilumatobacter nonamiensis TaxID=467093 RepID=UPI000347FE06|nr:HNH endonuclease signature motif containing protein [Ilumatobacter nonamiensis]
MQLSGVVERLERVVAATGSPDVAPAELRAALEATSEVQSFVAAQRAELVRALGEHPTSFPEAVIADTSGCSLRTASQEKERADTLGRATALADALSDGAISAGHVDVVTRATRNLDEAGTSSLLGDDETLAEAAAKRSIAEFDAYVKRKAKQHDTSDAEDRLERQRRATRLRTWTDGEGMWNLNGRFDPDLGKDLARRIATATRRAFAEETPATAPTNPIERTQHLEGLALADLILGTASAGSSTGPPIVVVDASRSDGAGGPVVDWGLPVELPPSVLHTVLGASDPDVVIVANGLVLHAAGRLDLGRITRLANRAQRRALQALYSTCAVPGCSVHFDRCKLHHVDFWRHGGRTDLDNLLPVCQHHHTLIHQAGWTITLDARRELTIRIPDGQVLRTGPPKRSAASRGPKPARDVADPAVRQRRSR